MSIWIDIIYVTALSLMLMFYSGWGIIHWLIPSKLQNRLYILVPFAGLFIIDTLAHTTSYANLPGYKSIWILGGVTTAVNIAAFVWRRSSWRLPNRFEWILLLCALPAIPLTVAPMIPHGELLPIGDDSNADPISHVSTTDWLRLHGQQESIEQDITRPVNVPVANKVERIRLGFHFYQMYVDILSGRKAYATYTIIVAVSFYLWSVAAGFFAGVVLTQNKKTAFLTAFLFSISALPLWISFGGYGPQSLGMGLLVMAFSLWVRALQTLEWRYTVLAAIFSSAFAGIYSGALPYLIAPVLLLGGLQIITNWNYSRITRLIKTSLLGITLTLIVNPIGWYRAIQRSLFIIQKKDGGGNVDWWIDLRQVASLIPFHKSDTYWFDGFQLQFLTFISIILGIFILFVFMRLNHKAKIIAISFIVPHIGSLLWFYQETSTYKYFKGWSMGWFLYLGLIAVGFITLRQQQIRPKIGRIISSIGIISITILFGRASIILSYSMIDRIASPPEIIELAHWTANLPSETDIYFSAGDLSRVSIFWATYHLQNHQAYVDKPIVYTQYSAQPYRGEAYVIRQVNGIRYWDSSLWEETIQEKNDLFTLLDITASEREYELTNNPIEIDAQLGNRIQLVGYIADLTNMESDGTLELTLYWHALTEINQSYKVFIHLLDKDGNLWGQYDGIPRNWTYYTYFWQPDEFVADTYEIILASNIPAGNYKIFVGMYHDDTEKRLPIIQNGQESSNSTIDLMSLQLGHSSNGD